jgi:3-dehydroquinate synthetase/shikimate kinase
MKASDHPGRDLVLCGPMGSGKTAVGTQLGRWLGWGFTDLDSLIVQREGSSVADLFARGEDAFRRAEADALEAWLSRRDGADPEVLALGGGTLEHGKLAEQLVERTTLVHLDAPGSVLASRLGEEARRERPLLADALEPIATLSVLRATRSAGYARSAFRIDTTRGDVPEIAVRVLRSVYDPVGGPWAAPARALDAPAADGVTVGRGSLPWERDPAGAVLWDRNLPRSHRDVVLARMRERAEMGLIEREGGESAKTPESLTAAWRELLEAGVDRDGSLWAAGGGTVTDLAGLLADTYKRGIILRLLPTTLVGQLDAALGGKNGINVDGHKNQVGTIRLPEGVHLDPLFLLTLNPVDARGGLSEAVKCGLIGDPELLDLLEERAAEATAMALPLLEEVIERAARVKLEIVARDLEERDERRKLNLGHTFGHALEAVAARRGETLPHGDAVAIGMVGAARLARRVGELEDAALPDRLEALLGRVGLPSGGVAGNDREAVSEALAKDKKRRRGENVWVLPKRAGELTLRTVPEEDVRTVLAEL